MKNLMMVAVAALFVGGFAHAADGDAKTETSTTTEHNADGSMSKETTTKSKDANGKKMKHKMKSSKDKDGAMKKSDESSSEPATK